jgi:hypothetical protein
MPSRQIVDFLLRLLCVAERLRTPDDVVDRTVDPFRAELRRRESLGFDGSFESPYPEVTW